MAKLSKMEISAIANKIAEDVEQGIREYNKNLLSEENFSKWFEAFKKTSKYKTYLKLIEASDRFNTEFKGLKEKRYYGGEFNVENTVNVDFKRIFEFLTTTKLVPSNLYSSIERDIIIAQAKNEDLDVLIASLTEKYSK